MPNDTNSFKFLKYHSLKIENSKQYTRVEIQFINNYSIIIYKKLNIKNKMIPSAVKRKAKVCEIKNKMYVTVHMKYLRRSVDVSLKL